MFYAVHNMKNCPFVHSQPAPAQLPIGPQQMEEAKDGPFGWIGQGALGRQVDIRHELFILAPVADPTALWSTGAVYAEGPHKMATRTALPKLGEYDPEHAAINANARALAAGAESFAVYAAR
jgi:hypothetical protein